MRYLVLLAQDERVWPTLTDAEQADYMRAHVDFSREVQTRATMLAGEALAGVEAATTLRHERGHGGDWAVVTDGPFAETTEQLGGFYLLDAPDLDTVLELCRLLPHAYTIEVRPAVQVELPESG
ncbi:YciI family protein [Nocardioides sp. 616]|uniref:YciI family protein n=1 Tax=Nocardioides sp. 616 TaxID=2268090 RepID=UPI000CE35776|nr:YciI family protein [Nocardioides sp. 616]